MIPFFEHARLVRLSNGLAVAVAASLPWSTSATSIVVPLWLLALIPTLDARGFGRVLATPAGALPVALWVLAITGLLWSNADWSAKYEALRGFHRLLLIPFLLVQFSRSDQGKTVLGAFVVACTALLCTSWLFWFWPVELRSGIPAFIPVKDYGAQSGEFLICAFALTHLAISAWNEDRRKLALALAGLAFAFLANITFVVSARSVLVTAVALVALLGVQRFGWKGMIGLTAGACTFAGLAWMYSPYLRGRVFAVFDEYASYLQQNIETSTGLRLEAWNRAVSLIESAPLIGHGTGSNAALLITANPHNLTLEIAIQFGLAGVLVLYAMWGAHLLLFRGRGIAAWCGSGLVVSDIIGSLFLSHLLDFTTGWIYVFGVGVLGGMVGQGRQVAQIEGQAGVAQPHERR